MRFLDFQIPTVSTVVDLGCGPGWAMLDFARQGAKVYGLELSPGVLSCARENLKKSGLENLDRALILGNSEQTPFRKNGIDCVVATELIEHTHNPEKLLSEIQRILKPGGYAILSFPVKPVENLICFFSKHFFRFSGHVRQFSIKEMRGLLERNGFRVVKKKNKYFEWSLYWLLRAVLRQIPVIDRTESNFDAETPEPRWAKFESLYKRLFKRLETFALGRWVMAAGNMVCPKSHFFLIQKY